MKNTTLLIILITTILFQSCKTKPNSHKPNPSGAAGIMVIVMNDKVKKTDAGERLWEMMTQPMLGLPQEESMFDVSIIPHRSFSDFMKTYRNIVVVEVGESVKKEGIKYSKETWAKSQALIRISAKSAVSMKKMVEENELKLVGFFTRMERERQIKYFSKAFNQKLTDKLKNEWNFLLNVPRDFSLRKESEDFIWMSQETSISSMGLLIYQYDYVGEGTLSREYILNKRNEVLKKEVPGPSKGSYMTTELAFPTTYQIVNTPHSKNAVLIRGLWRVEGDMMGGPFISMIHHNKKTNKVIVTEGYLYNPEKPKKRNTVRQLEAILHTYNPNFEKK